MKLANAVTRTVAVLLLAVCLGAYILFVLIYWIQNKALPFRNKQAVAHSK